MRRVPSKMLIKAVFITLTVARVAAADVVEIRPVNAASELRPWMTEFGQRISSMQQSNALPATGYTECAETTEVKNAFLCMSHTQADMNLALGRADLYVEGTQGLAQGSLVTHNDPVYLNALHNLGGLDLQGKDLNKFYSLAKAKCAAQSGDPQICMSAREIEYFDNFILPHTSSNGQFVLITFAMVNVMDYITVVSHEIIHAQYFLNPKFRKAVDQFWSQTMTKEERARVTQVLGSAYDAHDEFLIKNEFQAYILMANASRNLLRRFVPLYRDALIAKLAAQGQAPVQVK